jgi:hypothetical protein
MEETRIDRKRPEWVARVEGATQRITELPPEVREHGRRLNARYWALVEALHVLRGEKEILTDGYMEMTLEVLEGLKEEIDREYRAFEEEHGIPHL